MQIYESTMITFDLPTPDKRIELFRLDAEPIMKHVTPGFGLFISRFTDDMLVSYFKNKEIDKYQKNVPSHLRYFFLIRAVWNKVLLTEQRIEWEKKAEDEPHLAQLAGNTPDLFDRILKREIDRKLYERSKAFEEFKSRENAFKEYFMRKYNKNLELPSDSPFERTVNLAINVDYSESITSPHSIQLLKVFLNLEHFVNILLESDREKAIELLKQTVNYNERQKEYLLPMLSKLLPKSSSEDLNEIASLIQNSSQPVKTDDKLNYRQLAFYPLLILEKLLCHFSPDRVGEQKAIEFRHDALKLGVMDFVLECISHFTHFGSTFKKIRSWRMPLPQYSVFFCNETTTNRLKNDISDEQSQADSSKSSENSCKGKVFFAKGTGYGWGDVRQQWDYKESEQKLRYDDDNIACLLNILRAFIMPPIHEQELEASAKSSKCEKKQLRRAAKTCKTNETKNILTNRNTVPMEEEFLKLLHRSSLRSVIRSYLMSDSLLEVHKNVASYHAVFQLLVALSKSAPISVNVVELFGNYNDEDLMLSDQQTDDAFDKPKKLINEKQESGGEQNILPFDIIFCAEKGNGFEVERNALIELLKQFASNIDNYLKRIGSIVKPSQVQNGYFDLFTFFGFGRTEEKQAAIASDEVEEEQLHELSSICKEVIFIFYEQNKSKTGAASGKILRNLALKSSNECILDETAGTSSSSVSSHFDNKYCTVMQQQKFAVIPFDKIFKKEAYFFRTKLKKEQTSGTASTTLRRIAREIQSLQSNLMLTTSTSAFVRSCEEHLDAMKVLITGPEGTPYQNGCFEFDFFFPSAFPQAPPQVHLRTTGNNTVRFNPNLYNEGKVCLSILGTWHGRPEEQWNAERSSVLQVIISIQSLILVTDPYYNEPGYERYNNTQQGNLASRRYNATIQVATVRWAILEQLKRPPPEFESVVQLHFWLKRDEITSQITRWIEEWKNQSKQDTRFTSTADELEKLLKQVKDELQKLKKLNLTE